MIERDKPFAKLELDFETLEEAKEARIRKTEPSDRLRGDLSLPRARNPGLFRPDKTPSLAVVCDNCSGAASAASIDRGSPSRRRSPAEWAALAAPLSDELVEVVRKVLSGVARTRSRFGKNIVAQMLCGSKSAKMKRFGLQRLSTYGLLGHFKQDEVVELLDAPLPLPLPGAGRRRPSAAHGAIDRTGNERHDRPGKARPAAIVVGCSGSTFLRPEAACGNAAAPGGGKPLRRPHL